MNYSRDLLEQAEHLATRERRLPRQASLRRSVSTAYYGLFHLLTWEATMLLAPGADPKTRLIMQRWFDRAGMFTACALFSAANFSGPLARLAGSTPLAERKLVARSFRELQQERHIVDDDLGSHWRRVGALQQVRLADKASSAWASVRGMPQAMIFAHTLLEPKRVQAERPR